MSHELERILDSREKGKMSFVNESDERNNSECDKKEEEKRRIKLKPKINNNRKDMLTKRYIDSIFNSKELYIKVDKLKEQFNEVLLKMIEETDSLVEKVSYETIRKAIIGIETHKYHVLDL